MMKEFKEFIMRGNVLDLAVGIIIGGAFGKIVSSFVSDILMPPLGLIMGKVNFADLFINLSGKPYPTVAAAKAAGAPTINYGLFINTIIDFVIVAFAIFLMIQQVNEVFFREDGIAHHVDVLDSRNRAFVDVDLQGDPVARFGHDFSVDRRRVTTLGNILTLQFVTYTLKGGTLEDFTFGKTRLFKTFHQVISGNSLVSVNGDARNGRTFDNRNDEHIAITTQLDILKETGFEQRTSGFHQPAVIRYLTHVQRQRAKHATSGNPLQPVDTNIRDSEGLGVNFGDHQYGENRS